MLKNMTKRGLNIKDGILALEERFLSQSDKDFLAMIIDSIVKGQKVKVMKVVKPIEAQIDSSAQMGSNGGSKITSTQDKHNVQQVFEMLGGSFKKEIIEKVYIQNEKNVEKVIDLFLTGQISQDAEPELHVIIEQDK